MTPAQVAWVVSLVVAGGLLPVGIVRMVIYRSGEVDHTPTMRSVAWFALITGAAAFFVLLALTLWFLTSGERPL